MAAEVFKTLDATIKANQDKAKKSEWGVGRARTGGA